MAKAKVDAKVEFDGEKAAESLAACLNAAVLAYRRMFLQMAMAPEERTCITLIIDGFVENAKLFKAAPPDDDPVWEACANLRALFE